METTNESYQNLTQTQRDLKLQTFYKKLKKLYSQNNRIFILSRFNNFLLHRKKISFDTYIKNENRTDDILKIHNLQINLLDKKKDILLNTQVEVTPTTTSTITEDKTNIQIIKTQIEQSFKKISRNTLIFKYACFLRTIKKITSKELLLASYINKQKSDSLTRVHSLLVFEHARLYKVAKNSLLSI